MPGTGKIVHQMRSPATTAIDFKTVTANAVAHLKGTYTELVSSLPDDVEFVNLMFHNTSGSTADTSMLLDIAVGPSPLEVVKIPNVQVGFVVNSAQVAPSIGLPIAIPSGSRVAARCQAAFASDTVQVAMDFYGGFPGPAPADTVDALGVDTATSGGVLLTAGASHVKGAWTEIEDSTPNAYKALAVSFGGASGALAGGGVLVDVGVGAAGSETVLIENIYAFAAVTEHWQAPFRGIWPLENEIAAGSRIAARIQHGTASNADMELMVIGIK